MLVVHLFPRSPQVFYAYLIVTTGFSKGRAVR
jgi:hypothetical protein